MIFQDDTGSCGLEDREVAPKLAREVSEDERDSDGEGNEVLSKRIKIEIDSSFEQPSRSCDYSSENETSNQSEISVKPEPSENENGLDEPSPKVHSNGDRISTSETRDAECYDEINGTSASNLILESLEHEIEGLSSLLRAKEEEWNAVIKLKRLKELLLDHLRRRQDVLKELQHLPNRELDLRALLDCIAVEKLKVGSNVVETGQSIKQLLAKTQETNREIRESTLHEPDQRTEKNRDYLTDTGAAKITSNSRNEKRTPDTSTGKKTSTDSRSGSKSFSFPDPVLQSPSISYTDVLLTLAKISQHENKSGVDDSCLNASSFSSANVRQPSMTGINKTRNPLGSTLAKLLSSASCANGVSNPEELNVALKDGSNSSNPQSDITDAERLSLTSILTSSKIASDEKLRSEEEAVPLCQGCNTNRAQFVCAGCGNQWYCSRDCQVTAWDEHSDICSG